MALPGLNKIANVDESAGREDVYVQQLLAWDLGNQSLVCTRGKHFGQGVITLPEAAEPSHTVTGTDYVGFASNTFSFSLP